MVRIIPGKSWLLNPAYQTALRQLTERTARKYSPAGILDVLRIEIDGVPLNPGMGETAIFDAVERLADAVERLPRAPGAGGQVPLAADELDLVLGRRGRQAVLALVDWSSPARLVAGELEVELEPLAAAVADCADGLLSDLEASGPHAAHCPAARRLRRAARRLRALGPLAETAASNGGAAPVPLAARVARPARPGAPTIGLELRDPEGRLGAGADLYSLLFPGRVWLCTAEAGERLISEAPPFLAVTELLRGARSLLRAIAAEDPTWSLPLGTGLVLDLPGQLLRAGPIGSPARPAALAVALLAAGLDFCEAVTTHCPAQAANPLLSGLAATAREALAHARELEGGDVFDERPPPPPPPRRAEPEVPLGQGSLKRLRFRTAWERVDLGDRVHHLQLERRTLVALGRSGAVFVEASSGRIVARAHGERVALAGDGVLVADRGRLLRFGFDGRPRFRRDAAGHDHPALTATGGPCLAGPLGQPATLAVFDRHEARAILSASGREAWRFIAPQAIKVSAAAQGERVFLAADNGFFYALDAADGRVAFRIRSGYAFHGPLAVARRAVVSLGRRDGGAWVVALDRASGRPLMSRPLGLRSADAPVLGNGRIFVAGVADGDSVVVGFDLRGRELFRTALQLDAGAPRLTLHRGRLYCALRDGSAACLASDGRRLWTAGPQGLELDRGLAPVVRRGVVIVAGDPVRALDADTGTLLCELPPRQGLSALAVGRELEVYLADEDGVAACFKLATHLSIVR